MAPVLSWYAAAPLSGHDQVYGRLCGRRHRQRQEVRTRKIGVREAFAISGAARGTVEQIDGVIELDGEINLVEVKRPQLESSLGAFVI